MSHSETKTNQLKIQSVYVFLFVLLLSRPLAASTSQRITARELDPTQILLSQKSCTDPKQSRPDPDMLNQQIALPAGLLQQTINALPYIGLQSYASQIEPAEMQTRPVTPLKNELLKTNISSFPPDDENQSKQLLDELIKQVNSFEPKPGLQQTQNQPEEKTEPKMLPPEPNEEIHLKPEEKIIPQAQVQTGDLDPQLIKKIVQIVTQGGSVDQPQLLADMLYETARYEQAAYFYGLAANDETQDLSDNDKAWLLFQKGVCLAKTDPQQALLIYKNIISQFPNSPWAETAAGNAETLNWLQTQKPLSLIEQYKKEIKTNR